MEKYITGQKNKESLKTWRSYHVVSDAEADLNIKGMEEA
jgi:hypothetical protein